MQTFFFPFSVILPSLLLSLAPHVLLSLFISPFRVIYLPCLLFFHLFLISVTVYPFSILSFSLLCNVFLSISLYLFTFLPPILLSSALSLLLLSLSFFLSLSHTHTHTHTHTFSLSLSLFYCNLCDLLLLIWLLLVSITQAELIQCLSLVTLILWQLNQITERRWNIISFDKTMFLKTNL